ncbi:hypothetical protein RJ55_03063 [Drechmeria coniospora]|nr:hypothetical protein RJ55_03063 [Drechmeria coniospora]
MNDNILDANLEQLQQILGLPVRLRRPSEVENEQRDSVEKPTNFETDGEKWQTEHGHDSSDDLGASSSPAKLGGQPVTQATQDWSLANASHDSSSLRVGDINNAIIEFCPWAMIVRYPDRFIGKANKPRARPFFKNIMDGRKWDFFYLHDPIKTLDRPHLLVPTFQFEDFLDEINQKLSIALKIPMGENRRRFCLKFGKDGTPQPRFLQQSEGKRSLDNLIYPEASADDTSSFKTARKGEQDAFMDMLDKLNQYAQYKDKEQSALERAKKRASDRKEMMMKVQAYLDLEKKSPRRTVFICMDVEAIEFPPHPVSEVGIAILDTDTIRGTAVGESGSGWWNQIQACHIRTKEYSRLVNHKYVHGCPDAFDFGASSFATKGELVETIKSILAPYTNGRVDLVFVAHDTKQDVKFLSSIGMNVLKLPGMIGEIDTAVLHQEWCSSNESRSLRSVLNELGFENKNLHNAGNDAVYTMRAMIGLAVEQLRKEEAVAKNEEYVPAMMVGRK